MQAAQDDKFKLQEQNQQTALQLESLKAELKHMTANLEELKETKAI